MTTNWRAMQAPRDKKDKRVHVAPQGIKPQYMSMGSFHADLFRDGRSRKVFKGCGAAVT